jgi:hypothetical protein
MKKFLLTIIFIMMTNICFAEDVYITSENGFAKYLRSESLTAKVLPKNEQNSLFEMTYTLIGIPDKITLDRLRTQTIDRKISFKKQTFTFKCSFNKNSNHWNTDGTLWINDDELWGNSPKTCLYELHGNMPGGIYYGDSPEALAHRNNVIAIYNYVISHNLIEYY